MILKLTVWMYGLVSKIIMVVCTVALVWMSL